MKFVYKGKIIDVSKCRLVRRDVGISSWAKETNDYSKSGNEWYLSKDGIIFRLWVKEGENPKFHSCDESDLNFLSSNGSIDLDEVFKMRKSSKY